MRKVTPRQAQSIPTKGRLARRREADISIVFGYVAGNRKAMIRAKPPGVSILPIWPKAAFRLARENRRLRARLATEQFATAGLRAALEQQRREALTDPLTGLYNRRAMDQSLGEIWAESGKNPLAILVLDIDYLKRINDTYGHVGGDSAICRVAATLRRCIRGGDLAFRYGGEEFLVLLPNTTLDGAISVAELIRGRIESLHPAAGRKRRVAFTVSVGVAARKDRDDPISLIERADCALYQAKHHGRNQVVHENILLVHPWRGSGLMAADQAPCAAVGPRRLNTVTL